MGELNKTSPPTKKINKNKIKIRALQTQGFWMHSVVCLCLFPNNHKIQLYINRCNMTIS